MEQQLIDRDDQGHYFWELRACAYWQEFQQPKLFIPAIAAGSAYATDTVGFFGNDKTSICVSDEAEFLCAVLNSSVLWWVIKKTAAERQNGYYEFKPMYVTQLPIPPVSDGDKRQLAKLAKRAASAQSSTLGSIEAEINQIVYQLYRLTKKEIKIVEAETK